jgi:hypothetical protein
LAFASLGAKTDAGLTFRIQGKLYHSIGSLLPEEGTKPKFAQIYFHDSESALDVRMSYGGNRLKREVLKGWRLSLRN